jgi:hypothetical protein
VEWTQQATRRQERFDQAAGAKTLSSHLGSTLDYRRLLPENRDHTRLLLRGTAGVRTEIPDWSTLWGSSTVRWTQQLRAPILFRGRGAVWWSCTGEPFWPVAMSGDWRASIGAHRAQRPTCGDLDAALRCG